MEISQDSSRYAYVHAHFLAKIARSRSRSRVNVKKYGTVRFFHVHAPGTELSLQSQLVPFLVFLASNFIIFGNGRATLNPVLTLKHLLFNNLEIINLKRFKKFCLILLF